MGCDKCKKHFCGKKHCKKKCCKYIVIQGPTGSTGANGTGGVRVSAIILSLLKPVTGPTV